MNSACYVIPTPRTAQLPSVMDDVSVSMSSKLTGQSRMKTRTSDILSAPDSPLQLSTPPRRRSHTAQVAVPTSSSAEPDTSDDNAVIVYTQLSESDCAVVVPRLLLPYIFRKRRSQLGTVREMYRKYTSDRAASGRAGMQVHCAQVVAASLVCDYCLSAFLCCYHTWFA